MHTIGQKYRNYLKQQWSFEVITRNENEIIIEIKHEHNPSRETQNIDLYKKHLYCYCK